ARERGRDGAHARPAEALLDPAPATPALARQAARRRARGRARLAPVPAGRLAGGAVREPPAGPWAGGHQRRRSRVRAGLDPRLPPRRRALLPRAAAQSDLGRAW